MPPRHKLTLLKLDSVKTYIGHYTHKVIAQKLGVTVKTLSNYDATGKEIDNKIQLANEKNQDVNTVIDKLTEYERVAYQYYLYLCEGEADAEKECTDIIVTLMRSSEVDNVRLKAAQYDLERLNPQQWGLRGRVPTVVNQQFNLLQVRADFTDASQRSAMIMDMIRELHPGASMDQRRRLHKSMLAKYSGGQLAGVNTGIEGGSDAVDAVDGAGADDGAVIDGSGQTAPGPDRLDTIYNERDGNPGRNNDTDND